MIKQYAGKRVLVTGGTGSFGQAVVRHLLRGDVTEVRVLSRDEAKHDQMRQDLRDGRVRFYVGDVRDYLSVERAARDVELVFHAAALKQVPSCEFFPIEAVRTNIQGSDNVVRACEATGVAAAVLLSTDKAVYPINAMGLTKAMMEKVAVAHGLNNPHARTVVSRVRYGNVMYSRGSVIPLFVRQILERAPVTVTHPQMTRFMMSLGESVDLVDHAFTHARQGDLFVPKAPACTLADLVEALGRLFDARPEVAIIGVRHGEKMAESLLSREEQARAQDHGDYFRVPADSRDLNYDQYFDEGDPALARAVGYDSHTAVRLDVAGVEALLRRLPQIQAQLRAARAYATEVA